MLIDGSYGEGGGQILRTAVALSCLLGREITVVNIRKGRKNPGLKNQHLHAIRLASRICNARVSGLHVGSERISFKPDEPRGGKYNVNIGTAGSISLLLQTVIPIAIGAGEDFEITIQGGTDVPFSPPIDYYRHVLVPLLARFGARVEIDVIERGYYPEGGGKVRVMVQGSSLKEISLPTRGEIVDRRGYVNIRNLPGHISYRIGRVLEENGFEVAIDKGERAISRGCGVVLVEKYENTIIGADALCRKGVPAEKIAAMALANLERSRENDATVDLHMGDHLPVFSYIAGMVEYRVAHLTQHARTNLWLVEKFGAKVEVIRGAVRVQAYM